MRKLNVQSFPRPPLLEKTSRHLRITYQGQTLADTRDGFWVLETHYPPRAAVRGTAYYLPPSSVKATLTRTGRSTWCEWKGAATYWQATLSDGKRVADRIWSYEAPAAGFEALRGYLSFYTGPPWECLVDGERVEPQPGDFYGGWVTSDVEGVVKGARGNLDPAV